MIVSNGKFYVYSTGGGSKWSLDGLAWTAGPGLFPNGIPQSATSVVSNNEGVWAPDVIYLNNQYYLYYALANAQNACAVGLITSPTLDPSAANYKWTDRGVVVSNSGSATYCAIDPCPIVDLDGNLWLTWGSGYTKSSTVNTIYVTRLDNATGLVSSADTAMPGHPLEPGHIEASYLYVHGGYYYLFWNSGGCCDGASSTYEIHVARAQAITGPYTRSKVFYQSTGSIHGPGQIGIYDQCGASRFTYHYYPDTGGSVLGENELGWTTDGWPSVGASSTTPLTPCAAQGAGGAAGSGSAGTTGTGGATGAGGRAGSGGSGGQAGGPSMGGSSGGLPGSGGSSGNGGSPGSGGSFGNGGAPGRGGSTATGGGGGPAAGGNASGEAGSSGGTGTGPGGSAGGGGAAVAEGDAGQVATESPGCTCAVPASPASHARDIALLLGVFGFAVRRRSVRRAVSRAGGADTHTRAAPIDWRRFGQHRTYQKTFALPLYRRGRMKVLARIGILLVFGGALVGCKGTIEQAGSGTGASGGSSGSGGTGGSTGNPGTGSGTGSGGSGTAGAGADSGTDGGAAGTGGGFTNPLSTFAALRKIKNVLTGLPPTDAEVAADTDPAALQTLINGWMALPQYQDKMMFFFANAFQQSSLAVLNFEFQLRMRPGAFDLPYAIFGDNAFPMLFQNMQQSFARTCLQIISSGQPFTNVLTTKQFMMTTALMSMYMQIEMPYDIHTFDWKFNHGTRPALADTLNPSSPNYMVWGYAAPTTTTGKGPSGTTCAGDSTKVSTYPGSTNLFHVLLGVVDRDSSNNGQGTTNLGCFEHAIQPYFTPSDTSDWRLVTITNTGTPIKSYDLPSLRATSTLSSKLPRVSFFTTPSFLAIWNTNDSNQHRVTANQALLGALNEGFTDATAAIPTPPSAIGLDGSHAVTGSVCYACHKALDPMRQFWGNSYDYNDQVGTATSGSASFGFGNVTQNGTTLVDFGTFVGQVTDTQVDGQTVNRFALAMTQKLCFFANSAQCEETDPEMRRIALAFQNANYDFPTLVRQLFSSPLVTDAADTATFDQDGITISITRRDQLCSALSSRLGKPDICQILVPTPTGVTTALNRLAGSIDADAFSRGSQFPVTSSVPNLFYRAASELVCEAVAAQVVDATSGSVYSSSSYQTAIADMVVKIMGVPASDPHYANVLSALQAHYTAAIAAKSTATSALRSTFSAACQSPTSLALGI